MCKRKKVVGSYCAFHQKAYAEIRAMYLRWNEAYGVLSWERYLETILSLKETGVWAAEVARLELQNSK